MTAPKVKSRSVKRSAKKYWWFQGESVAELTRRLNANPAARLEVHLAGDKMTLEVVANGTDAASVRADTPINDSRRCPPICP